MDEDLMHVLNYAELRAIIDKNSNVLRLGNRAFVLTVDQIEEGYTAGFRDLPIIQ